MSFPSIESRTDCRTICTGIFYVLLFSLTAFSQSLDMRLLKGMKARAIGPAGMSGRVTTIDVDLLNPERIYIGTASGGLWRSENSGISWQPLFDDQKTASIGAVAIDPTNPDVIWVGTGEGNPRNSQSSGNGVYKSIDGGKTWQYLGLEKTRNIHRLIIHPQDPQTVYLAAQGPAWGENSERGIYKTVDGGANWKKVLYVNQKTGAADLVVDPSNPNKLLAAMWEYRRWPWFFKSGGPGSGLYVSFDGGESWKKRSDKDGLPKGELGRIGLAIAPSNPRVIYALIESKKNALYRSDDGGFKWKKTADKNIGNRPFYYADIFVDPINENRLYNLYSVVTVSEDGGKTFTELIPWTTVHPDHHAWWIHPENPDFLIDGNDGGLAISHDRGKTWRFIENLPLAQFYHINFDMETPYHVYGGMQDNGSWKGPGYVWRSGGIRNSYWEEVSFGDGFDVVPDPSDSRYGYSMWQGGNLLRYDSETGAVNYIRPIDPPDERLRFNWNAGIASDPHQKGVIYYGSQYLHKSTDQGNTWQTISPDLTTNDPEKQKQLESGGLTYDVTNAENYTTIVTISPSPLREGVIWVGSDDGNIQVTEDGGKSWRNTAGNIKKLPENCWVAQIHASDYDPAVATAVLNNYRQNDWTPYVYHTTNYGKSWKPLVTAGQVDDYALSFVQDPQVPQLMFLGTESGLYLSIDSGQNWQKWQHGYPTVSTMDMRLHPREHDLIIGTFGRAAYVLDDIRPLRALAKEGPALLNKPLQLFPINDAWLAAYKQAAGTRFAAGAAFSGDNRRFGAMISYSINPQPKPDKADGDDEADEDADEDDEKPAKKTAKAATMDSVTIKILDSDNTVIRTFKALADSGINRIYWGLRRKGVRFPSQAEPENDLPEPVGVLVEPGRYTVQIHYGDHQASQPVEVRHDPRIDTASDAGERQALQQRYQSLVSGVTAAADRLREIRKSAATIKKKIDELEEDAAKDLKKQVGAVQDSLKDLLEQIKPPRKQGITRNPDLLISKLGGVASYLSFSRGFSPTVVEEKLSRLEKDVSNYITTVNRFVSEDWNNFQQAVENSKLSFFKSYSPLAIPPQN